MARIVFLGTPDFGVPVLRALHQNHDIVAVVTQPDRRVGRGQKRLQAPPVKDLAVELGLHVLQPYSLRRDQEAVDALAEFEADLFVIAAYGQILRRNVLALPARGCIGVHASLLPRYRGAAPVAGAILAGEAETGITLMLTDAGMDTGPIIAQRAMPIADDDTTASLSSKLAQLGADLLIETLPEWLAGRIEPTPQDDEQATLVKLLSKADGRIDWEKSAASIDRQIRAYTPWPGSFCQCQGRKLTIISAHPVPDWHGDGEPGEVVEVDEGIGIVTGQGLLVLDEIQIAGKRAMTAEQFSRGRRDFVCSILD